MNSAEYVDKLIADQKAAGTDPQQICWNAALACVGWPYVFGARGEYCTPANRRRYYRDDHPTIKTKCKNFDGSGSCSGCQWLPGGKKVRFFDCRGFTYWILLTVYGWKLMGAGATAQWNNADNWTAKGEIGTMPKDTLCCLFVKKGAKMEHTGFGLNGQTVECSSGVQYSKTRAKKWTHWGVPKPVSGTIPPEPAPDPEKRPTLRKGDSGPYVVELQTMLKKLGYGLGPYGVDGKFGACTKAAVEEFQLHHKDTDGKRLVVDGICGPKTWGALDAAIAKLNEGSVS